MKNPLKIIIYSGIIVLCSYSLSVAADTPTSETNSIVLSSSTIDDTSISQRTTKMSDVNYHSEQTVLPLEENIYNELLASPPTFFIEAKDVFDSIKNRVNEGIEKAIPYLLPIHKYIVKPCFYCIKTLGSLLFNITLVPIKNYFFAEKTPISGPEVKEIPEVKEVPEVK